MRAGFLYCMTMLLRGRDIGLRPDFHLLGDLPPVKNREQRREEKKYLKRIR